MIDTGRILFRLSYATMLLSSITMSLWFAIAIESHFAGGTSGAYRVETFSTSLTSAAIEDFAAEHGVTIYTQGFDDDGNRFYVSNSGVGSNWLANGYRGILDVNSREVSPLSDLVGEQLQRIYFIRGDKEAAQAFASFVAEHGSSGSTMRIIIAAHLMQQTNAFTALVLVLLISGIGVFLGALASSRRYAISAMHGHGVFAQLRQDLNKNFDLTTVAIFAFILTLFCGYAWVLGSFSGLMLIKIFIALLVAQVLLAALAHTICIFFLQRADLLAIVKGKLPALAVLGLTTLFRVGLVAVIFSFGATTFGLLNEYRGQTQDAQVWREHRAVVSGKITGARDVEGIAEAQRIIADGIRKSSERGSAMLFTYQDAYASPMVGGAYDEMKLNHNAVPHTLSGNVVSELGALPTDKIVILARDPKVVSPDVLPKLEPACAEATCQVHIASGDYSAFTWQTGVHDWIPTAVTTNPIVAIHPNSLMQISDRNLSAALSRQDVGFPSQEEQRTFEIENGLEHTIVDTQPLYKTWLLNHHTARTNLVSATVGLCLTVIFTLLLAGYSGLLLRQSYRQHARVFHALGIPGWKILRKTGVWEAAVIAAGLGVLCIRNGQLRQWEAASPGAADPEMLAMAATSPIAIAVGVLAIIVSGLLSVLVFGITSEKEAKL